ncbi:START domain-containing protein [Segetibacter aerophilus]|uniref:START domain-containing protein n=1 Tax=Segetibacter aerophilus TaxID=670293 RepID=A0A512BJB3_9BACT|nr:START domain-containing protein [Segetibacter aerophilus]GEO12053.1 hypothetical protein SAE01_45490 [Segetibacter aerophilus]
MKHTEEISMNMTTGRKYHLLTTLFLLAVPFITFSQKTWELVKTKDDIHIYKRSVEGSSLKELKVVSTFQSSLSGFVAFIQDVPAQTSYMYNCSLAKVLKEINEKELIFYQQLKAPWPFSDRDGIYHQVIEQNAATKVVTIRSNAMSDYLPKTKDFIRVPKMKCSWIIKPNVSGGVDAEYYFYGEPGGTLPTWLINMFIAEAPYKTQVKIHELIKQKKYQEAKIDYIKN